jgi:D-arabinose 1-dehydrogenase-like Zn-dependent alcohol dehydrogenase
MIDPRCCVSLPADVDLATAALVEPVAVAVHALNRVDPAAGDRVLVVGAGTIGLCLAAAARARARPSMTHPKRSGSDPPAPSRCRWNPDLAEVARKAAYH